MTIYDTVYAQYGDTDTPIILGDYSFTRKEIAICELLSTTASQNKYLASLLDCDIQTIKNQLSTMYKKFRVHNRSGLILFWLALRVGKEKEIADNKYLREMRQKLDKGFNGLAIADNQIDHN